MSEVDVFSDEWLIHANEELRTSGCPQCGALNATITPQLIALPLGTFSLSGNQDKVSAHRTLLLECPDCGISGTVAKEESG